MFPRSHWHRGLIICFLLSFLLGVTSIANIRASQITASYPIHLVPEQLIFSGHVATSTNSSGHCPANYFAGTPPGTIVLGVNPTSCDPATWSGGSATVQVFLPDIYTPTILVLKAGWTSLAGKGIHSPDRNRVASIRLDGHTLWKMRTTALDSSGDYFATNTDSILITIVVTQTALHTLEFSVPPRAAWDLSQIEISAHPYPRQIQGLGYSPYRDCQEPGGEDQPSVQDIQEDLFHLRHSSTAIRTYAATDANELVPALANAVGLPVYAGAWIDYELESDALEINKLITLAHSTKLAGAIIGNEYYLRNNTLFKEPPEPYTDIQVRQHLVQQIAAVRHGISGTGVPIGTAEIDGLIFSWTGDFTPQVRPEYKEILEPLDFIMVHIYPFWMGRPIDGAAAFVVERFKAMQNELARVYPDKHLIIGETGWPSQGQTYGAAEPSPENQRRYMIEFLILAEQAGIDYMYFDPFDELWKIEEGPIGQNWGYSYADRTAKHDIVGVLIPSPLLPSSHQPDFAFQSLVQADTSSWNVYLPFIAREKHTPLLVYDEWPNKSSPFAPSGYMGDQKDVRMFGCDRSDPHSGDMAVRATFTPTGVCGWAGAYWQSPENNWGDDSRGINLTWANKVTFWAKGEQGGERVEFLVGGIGQKDDPFPDSLRPAVSTGFITLKNHWQKYTINLRGQKLDRISGGFGWVTNRCANPQGATFYLDDIMFEADPYLPAPPPLHGATLNVYTDAAAQDNYYIPSLWTGDGAVEGLVQLTECWGQDAHSGQTSIKISYTNKVLGWAGMNWVHPAENTGDLPGGLDLTGAKRLSFWARTDTPGATIKIVIGGIGYQTNYLGEAQCKLEHQEFADSVCPAIQKEFRLSPTWTRYVIDLQEFSDRDLDRVVGGFGWVATEPLVFYLDDITYEFELSQ